MDVILSIPLTDDATRVAFDNVGSVEYRDTVNGVRYTAHWDTVNGCGWIVQHEGHYGGGDGPGVARSPLMYGMGELNQAWATVRTVQASPDMLKVGAVVEWSTMSDRLGLED